MFQLFQKETVGWNEIDLKAQRSALCFRVKWGIPMKDRIDPSESQGFQGRCHRLVEQLNNAEIRKPRSAACYRRCTE